MDESKFRRKKDLPSSHLFGTGTPMCAGCGGLEVVRGMYEVLGERTVFVNAAGCMTMPANYPFTPFRGSWLYMAMASAAAGAQGVRDAFDILLHKGRMMKEEDLDVVVLAGDASSYGMGLAATSGAIERGLNFIYICYHNEGYGNTGQRYSNATPHGVRTATSRGPHGFSGCKKDLFAVWAAHKPAYAATVIASEPLDMARKVEKARSLRGPRLIPALSPCPTRWDYDPRESVEIGKMAVKTGLWPLKEYFEGKILHTHVPRHRPPVEEYMKLQGRFAHLFHPRRNEKVLAEIQAMTDAYWASV